MTVLTIIEVPDKNLRKKSKPVTSYDKKIRKLIADMHQTLGAQRDPEGVGLAAPQVGKNIRLFVVNNNGKKLTVINPRVVGKDKVSKAGKKRSENLPLEGCLSIPNHYSPLVREEKITIKYQAPDAKKKSLSLVTKTFSGFMAQIIAHEIDHLNGVLFIDHALRQDSPLYRVDGEEWEEVDI